MITPRVVVVCLVEDTFAFAMLGIMVPEKRENVHVSIYSIVMSRIFIEMCSKPEIFWAFLSKSNYSMIIVSTKQLLASKLCLGIEKLKGTLKL
jgi:hypothetical protein